MPKYSTHCTYSFLIRKLIELQWSDDSLAAFEQAKVALAEATLFFHPKPDAVVVIMRDASVATYCILFAWTVPYWASLQHLWQRIVGYVFVSDPFHWKLFFFFILTTNLFMCTKSERFSPQQARHLGFIVQFTTDIHFTNGTNNPVADALSRVELNLVESSTSNIIELWLLPSIIVSFLCMTLINFSHYTLKKVHNSALNQCLKRSHSTQKGVSNFFLIFTVSVALIWHLLAPLYCLYNSLQVDI